MATEATAEFSFSYSGSVTPKEGTHIKSGSLDMSFSGNYKLAASDAAHAPKIQKEFESLFEKAIKAQLSHLNSFIKDKDAVLDAMVKRVDELKSMALPTTPAKAAEFAKIEKEIRETVQKIDSWKNDYQEIVTGWAENCAKQQGLIALQEAVKAARVKTYQDKSFRVKAGLVVKATLVVIGIAASIAAIVLTAGATAPIFVALAAAGIALSGIGGLGGIAKSIATNANTEKKIWANVEKDVKTVQAAFGGVKDTGSTLRKHVTELANLVKMREDQISKLKADMQKYRVEAKSYRDQIKLLVNSPLANKKEVESKQKAAEKVAGELESADKRIESLVADNREAQKLLDDLTALGVQLDKITSEAPNTILGNLKQRFTSVDGLLELSNTLGGLSSSASSLHA